MASMGDARILYGLLRKMALDGWVAPGRLAGDRTSPERLAEVFRQLRTFCTVGTGVHAGLWRLNDEPRRRVFQRWKRSDLIEELRKVPDNAVAASLRSALGLKQSRTGALPAGELIDLRAAVNWLPERLQGPATPSYDELTQQIERTAVREDVNTLIGKRFVGRAVQRRRLHNLLLEASTQNRSRIVNIWGRGGIGKSTLLAAFYREIEDPQTIVLRLDFDRADLDPLVPTSLDREIIRQIGRAVPALWQESKTVMRRLLEFAAESARAVMAKSDENLKQFVGTSVFDAPLPDTDLESANATQRSELLYILELLGNQMRRAVFMVDTFERAEAAGPGAVAGVLNWIDALLGTLAMPTLVLVAGRRKLDDGPRLYGGKLVDMPLNQLSRRDSSVLLAQLGCPSDLARLLIRHLTVRSPLVLRLAADAVMSKPEEAPALFDKLQEGKIPDKLLSAYLYTRILAHIPQPILRQYALASIALPEVDVGVLAKVLMPEVEPDAVDSGAAQAYFEELSNVHWLIERTADRLRLRSDQRELVLQVAASDRATREMHQRVRASALAYHADFSGPWHRAMALYFRIVQAKEEARPDSELEQFMEPLREHAEYLMPFADEFPASLRHALSERRGNQVNLKMAANQLTLDEWRRLMDGPDGRIGRGQEIVSREDPLIAHELYMTRPTARGALPPAYALHAACDTARWDELKFDLDHACDELLAGFADADRWSPHLIHLAALLRHSLFSNPRAAPPVLLQLMEQIVPACSAYGAAVSVADMFAIAEVFFGQRYLSPRFLQALRSSPKTDRILLLHARDAGFDVVARLTGAAVVRFGDMITAGPVIMEGNSTAAIEILADLGAKRWSAFQRFSRDLGRSQVAPDMVFHAQFHLPEFYRPLRQAMLEAFAGDADVLYEFQCRLDELLPLRPQEFAPKLFNSLATRDPYTWLHALVQYADWCGVMLDVAEAASETTRHPTRLANVISLLRDWSSALARSPNALQLRFKS
jgi:hypothetical protein